MRRTGRDAGIGEGLRLALAAAVLMLAGCAHFPLNAPLAEFEPRAGHRLRGEDHGDPDDLTVILTFSGGGTRAAAFAYGVLEGLREVKLPHSGRAVSLLEEVDLIAAVSGGSVVASYYALYGERLFDDFLSRFLQRDFERLLARRLASPHNWFRLASPSFDRIDLLAEILDRELFDQATFRALQGDRPFLLIGATDITRGTAFQFTQERFDPLCADLAQFPVARAVAASAAVPVALTPVTLRNYGWEACGYGDEGPARAAGGRREHQAAAESFRDPARRPWLHLHDGGLVDNLGLGSLLESVHGRANGCGERVLDPAGRRVLVIVVNSMIELDRSAERAKQGPSLAQTVMAASNIPIDRNTANAIESLRGDLEAWLEWADECAGVASDPRQRADRLYPIVVDFAAVEAWDEEASKRLRRIPGRFKLDPELLPIVRDAGSEVLRRSPELARLLADLEAR